MNSLGMTKLGLSIVSEASCAESLSDHIALVMEHSKFYKFREVVETILNMYPLNLDELLDTDELNMYVSDKTGNDLFINDPERAERMYSMAAEGSDGSTHAEVINDWVEFVNVSDYPEWVDDLLHLDIDNLIKWHEENSSIDEVVG